MQRPQFAEGEIYHVFNRGVEKRDVFLKETDYLRFIHSLYEFNDEAPAQNIFYKSPFLGSYEVGLRKSLRGSRKQLVEILAFVLMPNHYHVMLRQLVEGGITEFMRKLGTGYTNFFNLKYDRVGPLFQGKFKAILLDKEAHFIHLPHYIHLNPLDLIMPEWREVGVKNKEKAIRFLSSYRWSSLPDYLSLKNFPQVIERKFLNECIGGSKEFSARMCEWMKSRDFDLIQKVIFE